MLYRCTIWNHAYTFGGTEGGATGGTDPVFDQPLAQVEVGGGSPREAAARAYVRCVGRKRARRMRKELGAPRSVFAQETNRSAIAASLRKTARRIGECYELDNFVEAWFIQVEPLPGSSPRPRRLRLSAGTLYHLLQKPSSS